MPDEQIKDRITVFLDHDAKAALRKIGKRDAVRAKKPKISARVRKAIINEAKPK